MAWSSDVGFRLAKVLAMSACAFIFPIPAVAVGTGELAAWYIEHAANSRERRNIRHVVAELEQIAEDVARRTLDQFGDEFRGVPENERNAATIAVVDTFARHPITRELAMAMNLSGSDLAEHLKIEDAQNIRSVQLSPDAQELYDLVLAQTCTDLMASLAPLPEIQAGAASEMLLRLQQLVDELAEMPERVYARTRSGEDSKFTLDYRSWVARTLGRVDCYCGLIRGRPESETLDDIYVSPPAVAHAQSFPTVEQALAGRSQVFLTGDRGGGKTIVLRRLAVLAAREGFASPLNSWNGRVPLFVPLRRHETFPMPGEFLRHIYPYADDMPTGWISRVISDGRALILMNGLDEVPAARRMDELPRLAQFADLAVQQGCVLIVTSRRGAVPNRWVEQAAFTTVDLALPGPADVADMVMRWHTAVAAALRASDGRALVSERCNVLLSTLMQRSDLRELASNPLSASLMCAIHLDNQVRLPEQWSRLIDEVAGVLAVRDSGRSIPAPSAVTLPLIIELERELASWAARNSRRSVERSEILPPVGRALARIGRSSTPSEAALDDITVRGSVFDVRPDGRIGMASEILHDHMAAGEIVADNDLGLVRILADTQGWQRLVLATLRRIGHARANGLLRELLSTVRAQSAARDRQTLLVLAGMESLAGQLEEALSALAEQRANGLVPPLGEEAVTRLVAQGDLALDVLAEVVTKAAQLPEQTVLAILRTAIRVAQAGNLSALWFIALFAQDARTAIQDELWAAWSSFDRVEYARIVLRHCVRVRAEVTADDPSVPAAVALLDGVRVLNVAEGCRVDLSPLLGRANLTVVTPTADNVVGAELLGRESKVIVGELTEGSGR